MPFPRASGILLHPTSFPSRFGIGDLGAEAYRFVDFLAAAGQQIWQILPLGPTAYGDSPYQCFSAIAGNPLLISPEVLHGEELLTDEDLHEFPHLPLAIDFGWVIHAKLLLLRKACENFKIRATPEQRHAFDEFCHAYWLEDYALFRALKDAHGGASWNTWDRGIAQRKPEVLEQWRQQSGSEIFFHKFLQFKFTQQWTNLKRYANERGIKIMGDLPIYVAHDSAEVWAYPEYFHLDSETGAPALMAGVPPDYFSPTGQLWGNPIYNWERLQQDNFKWWVQRFQAMLDCVDLIRIDHFRGFESYWAVPEKAETAESGEWMLAPGEALFLRLAEDLGTLPIIAEDLGFITPQVEALRDRFELPGMKILQFAFDGNAANPYLPFCYTANTVVYTGTHDNNTTMGWFNACTPEEQQKVRRYLGCAATPEVHWDLIRLAFSTVSNQAIVPLQDVLGFDSWARMNAPGHAIGNWGWRYESHVLTQEISDRLYDLTALYGRLLKPADRHY